MAERPVEEVAARLAQQDKAEEDLLACTWMTHAHTYRTRARTHTQPLCSIFSLD